AAASPSLIGLSDASQSGSCNAARSWSRLAGGARPRQTSGGMRLAAGRADQAFGTVFQAAPELGLDLRHEIVDHFLQDQLRRGSQLVIEVAFGKGAEGRSHGRFARLFEGLVRGGFDDFREQRDAVGVQCFVQRVLLVTEQGADRLEVAEQLRGFSRWCLRHYRGSGRWRILAIDGRSFGWARVDVSSGPFSWMGMSAGLRVRRVSDHSRAGDTGESFRGRRSAVPAAG